MMRIQYEKEGSGASKTAPGTYFDFFRRCQLNVAEYNGALIAMLLYAQYKMDSGAALSSFGKWGSMFLLMGTTIYASPAGMSSQSDEKPSTGRKVGAIMRYVGFGSMCYQMYK